jgi:hypothetical protein
MKNLYLLALVSLVCNVSNAQTVGINDPRLKKQGLFRQLPDSIPVDINSLEALLTLNAGSEVMIDLSLSRQHPLKGTVIASSEKYNGKIHAVSVRSSTPEGAVFYLSKSIHEDGRETYRGTWMHKDYADIYALVYNGKEYALLKKKLHDLVME